VRELKRCLTLGEQYPLVIGPRDTAIDPHLRKRQAKTNRPPSPPQPRQRGRKPHDPGFDVRTALDFGTGVDLTAIAGIDAIHALTLGSELGTDFSQGPTVQHFARWLGWCPNGKQTGGQVKSRQTRQGKNRAATALRLAAWRLLRSQSYRGASLRRQRSRWGAPKAITATAHQRARMRYHLLRYGGEYLPKTEAEYAAQPRARREKSPHRRAKELGDELTKIAPASSSAEPATMGA
jgi:hypothetical protein